MIAMVESAKRQKTPNEIALTILLVALTIVFLVVTVTLLPFSLFSVEAAKAGAPITVTVLVALLVCLIPTTIAGLLSAIGVAGMSRMMQANVIATSGRAVEAAGDVDVLLLDKTGTITLGNRQASRLPARARASRTASWPTRRSSRRWPTRRPRAAASSCWPSRSSTCASATCRRMGAHFVHFSAQTRMSGVNLPLVVQAQAVVGGDTSPPQVREIRKGAADAIRRHVEGLGGSLPAGAAAPRSTTSSRRGSTPLVVADGTRVLGVDRAEGHRQGRHQGALRRAAPHGHQDGDGHRRQPAHRRGDRGRGRRRRLPRRGDAGGQAAR